jgi:hypothetical protein
VKSPRIVIAVVAATMVAAGAGAATAAARPKPKPLCNLVTDAKGDVSTGNASLDVVGGDIASTPKMITAVIRVAKLTTEDLTSPTGRYYEFAFSYEGRGYALKALVSPTKTIWGDGKGTGAFDTVKNEVRISVPVDKMTGSPAFKPGAMLGDLLIRADVGNPAVEQTPSLALPMTFLYAGDSATGAKKYPINAASCVKVGA